VKIYQRNHDAKSLVMRLWNWNNWNPGYKNYLKTGTIKSQNIISELEKTNNKSIRYCKWNEKMSFLNLIYNLLQFLIVFIPLPHSFWNFGLELKLTLTLDACINFFLFYCHRFRILALFGVFW
jgi:hypothetical protein